MDGLAQGLGFFLVLVSLGALREWASETLILVALPPGAFIALGLLVALHQAIQSKLKHLRAKVIADTKDRRVRTTGDIS
jgi:Na+-translocating ferredoxin:NAD+ oxidoreductase RnfE subunit